MKRWALSWAGVVLALCPSAVAQAPEVVRHPEVVELPPEGQSWTPSDTSAFRSAAAAGDVNGDGLPDLVLGAPNAEVRSGNVYVLFGPVGAPPIDLSSLGDRGFVIRGTPPPDQFGNGDFLGHSVDGAGDVNGDGLDDVVLGAPGGGQTGLCSHAAGGAYVIFGKADSQPVDVTQLGTGGFRIDGAGSQCGFAGASVSGAGDFNGDRLADVVLTDVGANAAFVVFGKANATAVALGDFQSGDGLAIEGSFGHVEGGQDVDGDGRADVVLGGHSAISAYVVFGGAGGRLAGGETRGFRLRGRSYAVNQRYQTFVYDGLGGAMAMLGDVNFDGLGDIAFGLPNAPSPEYVPPTPVDAYDSSPETDQAGIVVVVFGKADEEGVDIHNVGSGGYTIHGPRPASNGAKFGSSVAPAGDLNGDGIPDLVIERGGPNRPCGYGCFTPPGGHVIYGKPDVETQRADALRGRGFGLAPLGEIPLIGAGDQSGDGRVDALTGGWLVTEPPPPLSLDRCSNSVMGTDADDTFAGTVEGDAVRGLGGGDVIDALEGDDCITGDDGVDVIRGGPGLDLIWGGPDFNRLEGGDGNDGLVGGRSSDQLEGGEDRDWLHGRGGRDTLTGDGGKDTFEAGRGADFVYARDGERDSVRCGRGSDLARADRRDVTVGCERVRLPRR
jgi:hypothetical protein